MGTEWGEKEDSTGVRTLVADELPPPSRLRAVLTVLSGSEVGRLVAVTPGETLKLGRDETCGVRFEDASLSRVHATVQALGAAYILTDEKSRNGTFVNGTRITTPRVLVDGDRVQLGGATRLRFSMVDGAEEAALRGVYEAGRRDALTGIANRKAFDERLDAEVAFATRHKTHLCLLFFDVDHFKRVNDEHGHPVGDLVLQAVAGVLARGVRTEDTVARYGGEEFGALARGIALHQASVMADRLRVAVGRQSVDVPPEIGAAVTPAVTVTVSIGVASLACCGPTPDRATLVRIADGRLYHAKATGRNRVVSEG